jgi:hypothetical protein
MRARFFAILMAGFVGAFALLATPAEAGRRHCYDGYYRGGYGYYRPYYRAYGYRPYYYRPYRYYRPYGYYRPYRYYRPYGYYRGYGPAFYLSVPPVRIAIGGGYW